MIRGVLIGSALAIGFSFLMAAAITSRHNPINATWYAYVCSNLMTDAERAEEGLCR